jgi:hypothetical protein
MHVTTLALALWMAWSVAHAESVDETRPLSANGEVSISNIAGAVDVSAWDRNEVRILGELDDDIVQLEISGDASHLTIVAKPKGKSGEGGSAELTLRVPAGAKVGVDAVSSDVTAHGLKGPLQVTTVSGDVNLSVASTEIRAETVSGDLQLSAPGASNTNVTSVSGDLRVDGVRGAVRLETVSGDVQVRAGVLSSASFKSVSGDIDLQASLAADGKLSGESLSGDIDVHLPAATSMQLVLHSFSGDVGSDFGKGKASDALDLKVGDGRGKVDLSSFSGDVTVHKN